jgi:WD40 repeat protein
MGRAALPLAFLTALSVVACAIVPLPPVGPQVGREEVGKLRPGVSTRAEVPAALGSPDRSVTERYELFDVSKEKGHLFVYVFPWWANVVRVGKQDLRVLAEYGPDDVLESLNWEGTFQDSDLSGTSHYLSSSTPAAPGGEGFQPALPTKPQPVLTWPLPKLRANSIGIAVAVAPEGPLVAISYGSSVRLALIELRNWQTGGLVGQIREAPTGCPGLSSPMFLPTSTVFLSDGRHLASIADEAVVCVWDSETRRRVLTFEGHRRPRSLFGLAAGNQLSSLVAARSVPILASADADNSVRVWDGLSGREILAIEPCASGPGCGSWVASSLSRLALSDDGRLLGLVQSGADEDALRLWDTTTGVEVGTMTTPVKTTPRFSRWVNLAISPDQHRVLLHLGDHVEVWSMATAASRAPDISFTLERVLIVPPAASPVDATLAFSADGRRLVAGGVAWEIDDWHRLWHANLLADQLTPDGRHIVTRCCVWELRDPTESAMPTT